jgi:hypothetical protein
MLGKIGRNYCNMLMAARRRLTTNALSHEADGQKEVHPNSAFQSQKDNPT